MRRTRLKGLPPIGIPTATTSTYRLNLQEIFDRFVAKYYADEKIKWRVEWGQNMTTNSAITDFQERAIKVSTFFYKRLYKEDVSGNKLAYTKDLEETILNEIIHVYLYFQPGNDSLMHEENVQHGECFVTDMDRMNGLLENGLLISVDHPAADKLIKIFKYSCTNCKNKISRSRNVDPTNLNVWLSVS